MRLGKLDEDKYYVGDSRPPQVAKQRSSISVNHMRDTLAGLADLVDSDSEEEDATENNKEMPSSPPSKTNFKTGGPEHRPLIGGFAAAAYEAARLDHYKKRESW